MKATDTLRSEHTIILNVLGALETIAKVDVKSGELDLASAGEALDFLRNFADRCHHTKEEDHFFPALATRGLPRSVGPLAVMVADHEKGRALLTRMSQALELARAGRPGAADQFNISALAYVDLIRDHIAKENDVLFPMGDAILSADDQTALVEGFERMEHLDMGEGAHERFLEIAERLCSRFGIATEPMAAATKCCGQHSPCMP